METRYYVCYNTHQDNFMKVVHDEAEWVTDIDDCFIFESGTEFVVIVSTLVGIYARLGNTSIIEYLNDCIIVPIFVENKDIVRVEYHNYFNLDDLDWKYNP